MLNDINFLKIAHEVAKGSKCISKQVGSVIVKDTRILSTGYTGSPSGYTNCCDQFAKIYTKEHHDWSLKYEIHSEMNAIVWAARNGISIEGATIYVSLEPCGQCTKNIIAAGIERIVYSNPYPHVDSREVLKFLNDNGVEVEYIDLGEGYHYGQTFKREKK